MTQAEQLIDVTKVSILQAVLDLLPPRMARSLGVLPVSREESRLNVCMLDRMDFALLGKVEQMLPEFEIVAFEPEDPDSFGDALARNYPDSVVKGQIDQAAHLFDYLLQRALDNNASDIHVCPNKQGTQIKIRVDGKLSSDRSITPQVADELVTYVKVLSSLDISQKREPQDGNIAHDFQGTVINLRVATVPTIYGEHVTLRVLSQTHETLLLERLDDLGMNERQYGLLKSALEIPNGVVIISGPTGSGKTTTLYAGLRELVDQEILHIVSIEDPVEKPVDGVTQIKVDSRQERVSFGKALRSVLRHDPDVIMIGEIRDGETAETALKSALTGHLVLTTLHTNSAPGILNRLVDLGAPRFLVAATLRLVMAQRLLRRPCQSCLEWEEASEEVCQRYGWAPSTRIPHVKGCAYCGMSGYSGRTAIYEMLPVTDEVRDLLLEGNSEAAMYDYLKRKEPALTLRGNGLQKVLDGQTTLEELERTVIDEDHEIYQLKGEV
ncbi:MAG: GspE/PulE family protein [Verrucomicrobiota bacterium]